MKDGKCYADVSVEERELVMCRNCKHWEMDWETVGDKRFCPLIDYFSEPEFFCADGERRDVADELLEQACRTVFGVNQYNRPDVREKSMQHQRCWAVYATIRYALAWHDHPEGGVTVDFQEPLGIGETMPKCKVVDE